MRRFNPSAQLFAIFIVGSGYFLTSEARSEDTDHLVQDIRQYLRQCKAQKPAPDFCAGLRAELLKRQAALKLSNDDINARLAQQNDDSKIGPRGGLHGGRGPWW